LSDPMVAFGISAVKNELGISGSKRPDHGSHCMTLYVSRQGRKFPMRRPRSGDLGDFGRIVAIPDKTSD
jgi:hypothetical protein